MLPHPSLHRRAGFSLLEVVIVLLIVTILGALAAQALSAGSGLNTRITAQNDLTGQANRVLNELALELRTVDADDATLKLPDATDPDSASDTVVYKYKVSQGIRQTSDLIYDPVTKTKVAHTSFHTLYEPGYHKLVYNKTAGTLTSKIYSDSYGTLASSRVLCDRLVPVGAAYPRGGFSIDQIGNTLAMQLALQTTVNTTGVEDQIVHVSQAQVLFLRSTLNSYTGSCPYADPNEGAPTGATLTTTGPAIFFGNSLNYVAGGVLAAGESDEKIAEILAASKSQVTVYLQPPVGRDLDPASIAVTIATDYQTGTSGTPPVAVFATSTQTLANKASLSFSYGGTLYYGSSGDPSTTALRRDDTTATSGCYTIILQGTIAKPITVTVSAASKGGATTTVSKMY